MKTHELSNEPQLLLPPEMSDVSTKSRAAYFAYFRGLTLKNQPQFSMAALETAANLIQFAVREDNRFTEAWAELSCVHSILYFNGDQTEHRRRAAQDALKRAQTLDPDLPIVGLALGFFRYHVEHDTESAFEVVSTLARQLPDNAEILAGLGFIRRRQGHPDEAIKWLAKAFALQRIEFKATLAISIAQTYNSIGDYDSADHWFIAAEQLAPDCPDAFGLRALNTLVWKGCPPDLLDSSECSTEEALRILARFPLPDDPRFYPYQFFFDLYTSTLAPPREAREIFGRIIDRIESTPERKGGPKNRYFTVWREAQVYEWLGLKDRGLRLVESSRATLEEELNSEWNQSSFKLALLGIFYAFLGNREKALELGASSLEQASGDAYVGPSRFEDLAVIHLLLGEEDLAIDQLKKRMAHPSRLLIDSTTLRLDPVWNPLRGTQRFQRLLQQLASRSED